MRTIIDLPPEQITAVARLCAKEGISRAEAIRRALAKLLSEYEQNDMATAFGAWSGGKLNSRDHVDKIRSEWDR